MSKQKHFHQDNVIPNILFVYVYKYYSKSSPKSAMPKYRFSRTDPRILILTLVYYNSGKSTLEKCLKGINQFNN